MTGDGALRRMLRPRSRGAVILIGAVAVVLAVLAFGGREERADPTAVPLGSAADYPVGSVTEIVLGIGHHDWIGVEDRAQGRSAVGRRAETRIFLVNHEEGGLLALLARSPWRGCRVNEASADDIAGYGLGDVASLARGFIDPCHGVLFSLDGSHVAGPGRRNLDRFAVSIGSDGSVVVDLTMLERG